jgi:SpoVK/Ycf46/Vps4 family AAA+-type ATPase
MYQRNIEQHIKTALKDTPVVFLNGARQTGKTTLAQKIAQECRQPLIRRSTTQLCSRRPLMILQIPQVWARSY